MTPWGSPMVVNREIGLYQNGKAVKMVQTSDPDLRQKRPPSARAHYARDSSGHRVHLKGVPENGPRIASNGREGRTGVRGGGRRENGPREALTRPRGRIRGARWPRPGNASPGRGRSFPTPWDSASPPRPTHAQAGMEGPTPPTWRDPPGRARDGLERDRTGRDGEGLPPSPKNRYLPLSFGTPVRRGQPPKANPDNLPPATVTPFRCRGFSVMVPRSGPTPGGQPSPRTAHGGDMEGLSAMVGGMGWDGE